MDRREQWKWVKATALAASLGLACAMPVAAQTSGQSGSSDKQSQSANSSQQSGGQNASTGQSSPSDLGMQQRGEEGRDWGWLGLLGLIGLAGLRRREHHHDQGVRRPT
ncbi:MAG TPA: WGxxGxxG family protein [Burkholderiales bacterium]|nr:WGxxGxxG family protein [Burkholderiales bacterium]